MYEENGAVLFVRSTSYMNEKHGLYESSKSMSWFKVQIQMHMHHFIFLLFVQHIPFLGFRSELFHKKNKQPSSSHHHQVWPISSDFHKQGRIWSLTCAPAEERFAEIKPLTFFLHNNSYSSVYVSGNKHCRVMTLVRIGTDHLTVSSQTNAYLTLRSPGELTRNFAVVWMPQH